MIYKPMDEVNNLIISAQARVSLSIVYKFHVYVNVSEIRYLSLQNHISFLSVTYSCAACADLECFVREGGGQLSHFVR